MAGDVNPVVIPVVATVDQASFQAAQSARQMLGESVRSARETGAAPAAAAAATPEFASVRTLIREFQEMGGVVREVTRQLEKVGMVLGAVAGATARPAASPLVDMYGRPLTPSPSGPPALSPSSDNPREPDRQRDRDRERDRELRQFVRDLVLGGAGVVGLGYGMRAGFQEVSTMVSRSRDYAENALTAGARLGMDPTSLAESIRRRPGLVDPNTQMGIVSQLAGLDRSPRSVEEGKQLAQLGQILFKNPQAGAQFGADIFSATRTQNSAELLMTLVKMSDGTTRGVEELVRLTQQILRMQQGEGGTMRRPTAAADAAALVDWLRKLPGGIGEGQGGADLGQELSHPQGPMGAMMLRMAFLRTHPNVNMMSPQGEYAFREWRENEPKQVIPAVTAEARRQFGFNTDLGAIFLENELGVPVRIGKQLLDGRISPAQAVAMQSEQSVSKYVDAAKQTAGGTSAASRAERAAGEEEW